MKMAVGANHAGFELKDDLNILLLGARLVGTELAGELAGAFSHAVFGHAVIRHPERHVRRLAKIHALEIQALENKGKEHAK